MNRQPDIDQLLRGWLDEGETTPPERYVWAALERVETTRQRGALLVSLEEFIMRAQPLAAAAVVAIVAVIGLAVYFALAGGPNVGDPDATPTANPGAVETEDFSQPFSVVPPEGWILLDEPNSVAVTPLPDGSVLSERISVLATANAGLFGGIEEHGMSWPDDLATWLEDHPAVTDTSGPGSADVTVTETSESTVAGSPAQVIEATTSFTATPGLETSISLIGAEPQNVGTDVLLFDGTGQMRFVVLDERDLVIVYHAADELFSEARFQSVLDSLSFLGG